MTDMTPSPLAPAARTNTEHAGLDARLSHVGGWQALSITASPQAMDLTVTNRTSEPVSLADVTLRLLFRPGILTAIDRIALAPQSERSWHLAYAIQETDMQLVLRSAVDDVLAPGEALVIRFLGVSAAREGGSRATRVQMSYVGAYLPSGVEAKGHCLIHLPVLRRQAPSALTAAPEKSSSALAGPFLCGIVSGRELINDGLTTNVVVIRLMNVSREPVVFEHLGDAATRIRLHWRTGTPDADFGLLGADGSHLSLSIRQPGWDVQRHSLHRMTRGALIPGDFIEFEARIHTNAADGEEDLTVTFENLRDFDDGDLRLSLRLGAVAAGSGEVRVSRSLSVSESLDVADRIRLHSPADPDKEAAHLRAHPSEGHLSIVARNGIHVANRTTFVQGVDVSGDIRLWHPANGPRIAAESSHLVLETDTRMEFRGDVRAKKELHVTGRTTLHDGLYVEKETKLKGSLEVADAFTAKGSAHVDGTLKIVGEANLVQGLIVGATLTSWGHVAARQSLTVDGIFKALAGAKVDGILKTSGDVRLGSHWSLQADGEALYLTFEGERRFMFSHLGYMACRPDIRAFPLMNLLPRASDKWFPLRIVG